MIIGVFSGKGGVGKTTVALNIANSFSKQGSRALLIDADLYTPNVGLSLGSGLTDKSSFDVIKKDHSIFDVVYRHSCGINFVPAKISSDFSERDFFIFSQKIVSLKSSFDVIILDMPSGLGPHVKHLLSCCDSSLIVTSPDLPSVANSLKAINVCKNVSCDILGVVVNMVKNSSYELSSSEIESFLGAKILSSLDYDDIVKESVFLKSPVFSSFPRSSFSQNISSIVFSLMS